MAENEFTLGAQSANQTAEPVGNLPTNLGFGDDILVPGSRPNPNDPRPLIPDSSRPNPIYADTVIDVVQGLSPEQRGYLALDMFLNVPGAYGDVSYLFNDDGTVNDQGFINAFSTTLERAEQFGPDGIGSGVPGKNSVYLDILLRDSNMSPEELKAEFAKRQAEIEAEKAGSAGGGGGGRVINYIDPVALAATAEQAFASTTGRKATVAEQQSFVKTIHSLQATGATGIDVGSRAGAFAQSSAPVEAAAMDHAGAAQLLMQAIGV
jgi:hypothetical protein